MRSYDDCYWGVVVPDAFLLLSDACGTEIRLEKDSRIFGNSVQYAILFALQEHSNTPKHGKSTTFPLCLARKPNILRKCARTKASRLNANKLQAPLADSTLMYIVKEALPTITIAKFSCKGTRTEHAIQSETKATCSKRNRCNTMCCTEPIRSKGI